MSDKQASVILSDTGVSLKGELVYSTVSDVLKAGNTLLENHQANPISIDMSAVKKIDSAGIVLLLGWKRLCEAQNKTYQIESAQDQSISLITTNKMDKVLNLI